jgi:hypothetical protein
MEKLHARQGTSIIETVINASPINRDS